VPKSASIMFLSGGGPSPREGRESGDLLEPLLFLATPEPLREWLRTCESLLVSPFPLAKDKDEHM
jgi:hypothetical protein